MTLDIIICTDRTRIELMTPGSAVRNDSVSQSLYRLLYAARLKSPLNKITVMVSIAFDPIMHHGLDPDQDRLFVGPDLDPNCLQRL